MAINVPQVLSRLVRVSARVSGLPGTQNWERVLLATELPAALTELEGLQASSATMTAELRDMRLIVNGCEAQIAEAASARDLVLMERDSAVAAKAELETQYTALSDQLATALARIAELSGLPGPSGGGDK